VVRIKKSFMGEREEDQRGKAQGRACAGLVSKEERTCKVGQETGSVRPKGKGRVVRPVMGSGGLTGGEVVMVLVGGKRTIDVAGTFAKETFPKGWGKKKRS